MHISKVSHSRDKDRSTERLTPPRSQLKVKPRRANHIQPCALELTAMLGCWASAGDLASAGACKESAKKLHECMMKPVRPLRLPSQGECTL